MLMNPIQQAIVEVCGWPKPAKPSRPVIKQGKPPASAVTAVNPQHLKELKQRARRKNHAKYTSDEVRKNMRESLAGLITTQLELAGQYNTLVEELEASESVEDGLAIELEMSRVDVNMGKVRKAIDQLLDKMGKSPSRRKLTKAQSMRAASSADTAESTTRYVRKEYVSPEQRAKDKRSKSTTNVVIMTKAAAQVQSVTVLSKDCLLERLSVGLTKNPTPQQRSSMLKEYGKASAKARKFKPKRKKVVSAAEQLAKELRQLEARKGREQGRLRKQENKVIAEAKMVAARAKREAKIAAHKEQVSKVAA